MLGEHTVPRTRRTAAEPGPLMSKLFDESGKPLTLSHAVKDKRREGRCAAQTARRKGPGVCLHPRSSALSPRLAAQLLRDHATVTLAAQEVGIAGDQLETVLRHARQWAGKLQSPAEAGLALSSLMNSSGDRRRSRGRRGRSRLT